MRAAAKRNNESALSFHFSVVITWFASVTKAFLFSMLGFFYALQAIKIISGGDEWFV